MDKKIVIIGANQCALFFAELSAKQGYETVIYEAKAQDSVAYDWTDDLAPATFEMVGLPMPPNNIYKKTHNATFIPPESDMKIRLNDPIEKLDVSIMRRPFNSWLAARATKYGATIFYDTPVESLVIENETVIGVVLVGGEIIRADMVVDCGGVNSITRQSLNGLGGITDVVRPYDKFYIRRNFYNTKSGVSIPEDKKKIYLKPNDINGISWCFMSADNSYVDLLVGGAGGLQDDSYENAKLALIKDNEIVGDYIKGGETVYEIPIRCPLSRFVMSGYALLGDSACMTIPMIGSGIASGMRAAKILMDTINTSNCDNEFDVSNLYRYQREFMAEIGGGHAAINNIKNWLLSTNNKDLNDVLKSGIMAGFVDVISGSGIKQILKAALKLCFTKHRMFDKLMMLLIKTAGVSRHASNMPKMYDVASFKKWADKYDRLSGIKNT